MTPPYYEDASVSLYHGDCLDVLQLFDAVDHVITDPPYSAHVHASTMRGAAGWKGEIAQRSDLGFAALDDVSRRVCGGWFGSHVRRWMLVFSDTESAHLWRYEILADYVRTMFWRKVGGAPQFTGDRPAVACEAITVCHRAGKKRWNGGGKQGFYDVPIVLSRGGSSEVRCHTTQKPEALMAALIADFTDENDLILDPFAGSGTTGVAAKRLGRRAILIEREEKYCEVAAKRLQQGALDLWAPSVTTAHQAKLPRASEDVA